MAETSKTDFTEDLLLLEDNWLYGENMVDQIPDGLIHKLVKDGKEFEEYLAKGGRARLYFLDDKVPDASGDLDYHFVKHCTQLLEQNPDAKIFYHGSFPGSKESTYCNEHNIPRVNRKNIRDVILKELANPER